MTAAGCFASVGDCGSTLLQVHIESRTNNLSYSGDACTYPVFIFSVSLPDMHSVLSMLHYQNPPKSEVATNKDRYHSIL